MLPHTVCNPYSAANNKCGNPHLKLLPGFSWWGKMVLRNTFSGVCSQFRDNYTFTVHHSNSHSSLQKFNRAWGSFESVGFCTSVYCKQIKWQKPTQICCNAEKKCQEELTVLWSVLPNIYFIFLYCVFMGEGVVRQTSWAHLLSLQIHTGVSLTVEWWCFHALSKELDSQRSELEQDFTAGRKHDLQINQTLQQPQPQYHRALWGAAMSHSILTTTKMYCGSIVDI